MFIHRKCYRVINVGWGSVDNGVMLFSGNAIQNVNAVLFPFLTFL